MLWRSLTCICRWDDKLCFLTGFPKSSQTHGVTSSMESCPFLMQRQLGGSKVTNIQCWFRPCFLFAGICPAWKNLFMTSWAPDGEIPQILFCNWGLQYCFDWDLQTYFWNNQLWLLKRKKNLYQIDYLWTNHVNGQMNLFPLSFFMFRHHHQNSGALCPPLSFCCQQILNIKMSLFHCD